jgi:hypothetical protein
MTPKPYNTTHARTRESDNLWPRHDVSWLTAIGPDFSSSSACEFNIRNPSTPLICQTISNANCWYYCGISRIYNAIHPSPGVQYQPGNTMGRREPGETQALSLPRLPRIALGPPLGIDGGGGKSSDRVKIDLSLLHSGLTSEIWAGHFLEIRVGCQNGAQHGGQTRPCVFPACGYPGTSERKRLSATRAGLLP